MDADHIAVGEERTSLTGTGGNLQLGKAGDGLFMFETGGTWRSPELEMNDIGFQRESDYIRHLNGEIEQRTLSMSVRLNYNINPDFTVQYWGQPFISMGKYSNFKHVTDATAHEFNNLFLQYDANQVAFEEDTFSVDEDLDGTVDFTFDDPDFAFVQFRSNLVIRWEYIAGSEIFLVWPQDVSQSGGPTNGLFANLEDNIFGQSPQNIFLLKATYRFVF